MSQARATAPRSRVSSASPAHRPRSRNVLAFAALGVVFGDIGTSPLYAMQAIFTGDHPVRATPADVYGVISLVAWSLTLMVLLSKRESFGRWLVKNSMRSATIYFLTVDGVDATFGVNGIKSRFPRSHRRGVSAHAH